MASAACGAVLCALLVLTACGSDDPAVTPGGSPAAVSPSTDPCLADDAPQVCAEPTATPTDPPPAEGSAFWDALVIDPLPGQLAAVGNDVDVNRTSAALRVTVRAGNRLGVQAVCEGRTSVTVETVPPSEAAVDLACGFRDGPEEIGAVDPVPVTTTTTYAVSVSAPAPSRWYAALYEAAP